MPCPRTAQILQQRDVARPRRQHVPLAVHIADGLLGGRRLLVRERGRTVGWEQASGGRAAGALPRGAAAAPAGPPSGQVARCAALQGSWAARGRPGHGPGLQGSRSPPSRSLPGSSADWPTRSQVPGGAPLAEHSWARRKRGGPTRATSQGRTPAALDRLGCALAAVSTPDGTVGAAAPAPAMQGRRGGHGSGRGERRRAAAGGPSCRAALPSSRQPPPPPQHCPGTASTPRPPAGGPGA